MPAVRGPRSSSRAAIRTGSAKRRPHSAPSGARHAAARVPGRGAGDRHDRCRCHSPGGTGRLTRTSQHAACPAAPGRRAARGLVTSCRSQGAAHRGEITMPALPLARRPPSGGSCPSECPSRGARSPVLNSNYTSDLGGAKRARTADLLHAMGNADVQYRQMLARDDPCGSMPHGPRPERRSDHGQKDLETMRDHMITSRSAPRTP